MKKATIWRMCGKVSEPCLLVLGKWLSSLLTHSGVGVTRLPALEICQSPPSHSSAQSGPANQSHDREHSTSQCWGPMRDSCFVRFSIFQVGKLRLRRLLKVMLGSMV